MPVILFIIVALSSLASMKTSFTWVIPTPFFKRPFEFTVGFRNTFYLFISSYCLTGIAVAVDNFNLGVFAFVLLFITMWTYYLKPENPVYVWIHSLSSGRVLIHKMKIALQYSFLSSLPILFLLSCFYWENAGIFLLLFLLGYLFLTLMILAKYAAYPDEINLLQVVLIVLCISFPPLLIVVIPYFFNLSVTQLNHILK
jgi:hypothetical protein